MTPEERAVQFFKYLEYSAPGAVEKLASEFRAAICEALDNVDAPSTCPACGNGNRLNGRIIHGPNCPIRYSTKAP